MSDDIVFTRDKHIGIATLNRPQALNALTLSMIKTLQQQLWDWEKDPQVHAVVIEAAAGKAFCAGGDVRWLYERGLAGDSEQAAFFRQEYRLNNYIHNYPKPYIAMMDGITMGGGVGISLHGSHQVAAERFSFAMPETGIGFFPDIGSCYLLVRCPDSLGLYLGLTGTRIKAEQAHTVGLVSHVIVAADFVSVKDALSLTDLSADAHVRTTDCLNSFTVAVPEQPSLINDAWFDQTSMENIFSILQKSEDERALSILENLQQKSPLSLKITMEQMQRAKNLSLAQCLGMDYCLVRHFMERPDFYEGVRALLIDKDKAPRWEFERLQEVTMATVAEYFECDHGELELSINLP